MAQFSKDRYTRVIFYPPQLLYTCIYIYLETSPSLTAGRPRKMIRLYPNGLYRGTRGLLSPFLVQIVFVAHTTPSHHFYQGQLGIDRVLSESR